MKLPDDNKRSRHRHRRSIRESRDCVLLLDFELLSRFHASRQLVFHGRCTD